MSPEPTPVEVLAGQLLGAEDRARALPSHAPRDVRVALEQAILPALQRPPCFVSFSGGRDSSAILAVATGTARRHGTADPVPVSLRFPGVAETAESEWQQLVLAHLDLSHHEVVEVRDELDLLGPTATSVLRRNGLRWPSNGYLHAPMLDLARRGSLLTGAGGDELLGTRAAPHVLVTRRRGRPAAGGARSLAVATLPRRLRALVLSRSAPERAWLTSAGQRLVNRALARDEAGWPSRWDASVRHWHRSRAYAAVDGALAAMAQDRDVSVVNPFLAPAVLAALAATGGATGFPSREAAMRQLFGDLLPGDVLSRGTKASFSSPLWGPAARAFAAGWQGGGVDGRYVDAAALRGEWLSEQPNFQTSLLLHAAWLHEQAGEGQPSSSSS